MTSVPLTTALLIVDILVTIAIPIWHRVWYGEKPIKIATMFTSAFWLVPVGLWIWLECSLYNLRPSWFNLEPNDINAFYACFFAGFIALAAAVRSFISPYVDWNDIF